MLINEKLAADIDHCCLKPEVINSCVVDQLKPVQINI